MFKRHARKRRGGHRSRKVPVAATAGAIGTGMMLFGGASGYTAPLDAVKAGNMSLAAENLVHNMKQTDTWMPLAVGVGISMLASRMGANRYVKIPFFKI